MLVAKHRLGGGGGCNREGKSSNVLRDESTHRLQTSDSFLHVGPGVGGGEGGGGGGLGAHPSTTTRQSKHHTNNRLLH